MLGESLAAQGLGERRSRLGHIGVKVSVFPFNRFPGVDAVLGPEMKSTGEVMGIDDSFGLAFAKGQLAAGAALPLSGTAFVSVRDSDKEDIVPVARTLHGLGFKLLSTGGTNAFLRRCGVPSKRIRKVSEGQPNVVDYMKNRDVHIIINTPSGKYPHADEVSIRSTAIALRVPLVTTTTGAEAAATAIQSLRTTPAKVKPLQEYTGGEATG